MDHGKNKNYDALENVLELYGADSAKWPGAQRDDLLAFIAEHKDAADLYEEHKALDGCLALASPGSAQSGDLSALTASIMAQAMSSGQNEMKVVPLEGVRKQQGSHDGLRERLPDKVAFLDSQRFAGLALLAASLVLGVFIGLNEGFGIFIEQGIQIAFAGGINSTGSALEEVLLGSDIL